MTKIILDSRYISNEDGDSLRTAACSGEFLPMTYAFIFELAELLLHIKGVPWGNFLQTNILNVSSSFLVDSLSFLSLKAPTPMCPPTFPLELRYATRADINGWRPLHVSHRKEKVEMEDNRMWK